MGKHFIVLITFLMVVVADEYDGNNQILNENKLADTSYLDTNTDSTTDIDSLNVPGNEIMYMNMYFYMGTEVVYIFKE